MSDFMALVSRQSFLHYVNLCKIHAIGESSPAMLSFRLGIVVHDLGTEALPSKAMASRLCHPGLDLDVPGLALSSKALAPRSWSCSATLWPCRPMPWQLAPRSWPCNARPWPCGPRPLHPGLAVPSQGLVVQGLGSQSLWSKIWHGDLVVQGLSTQSSFLMLCCSSGAYNNGKMKDNELGLSQF